jgi:TfoX/Sxy family transcriptional regulator of competence genes
MAYDEQLATRLRGLFANNPDISEKKMFGGLCFLNRGLMFIGITGNELMARIGPANYPSALQQAHVREMDFTGKPMKGYVFVAPAGITGDKQLDQWAEMSLRFTDTLPPKVTNKK